LLRNRFYFANKENVGRFINLWDVLILLLVFAILFFLGWAGKQMASPYHLGGQPPISLAAANLPFYAVRTVLRMFIALGISLIFTLLIGTMAAKSRRAEQVIIPSIDILQSVPVLSFLSITVAGFIRLFPGSMLGPECACIFATFTAQVWNITFGFYQSLKTVPHDLKEAAAMYQLSAWQRFWKLEVPFSMTSLIWNMMMSMSASWFFVVLSEAISVAHQEIRLPGVGSYIAVAIEQHNLHAIGNAIVTMIIVIFLYDQILFRPLIAWSEKFKFDQSADEEEYESWLVNMVRRSRFIHRIGNVTSTIRDRFINQNRLGRLSSKSGPKPLEYQPGKNRWIFNAILLLAIITGTYALLNYILSELKVSEVMHVFFLGAMTGTRVIILIIISSIIWIPVGVWVGMRPRVAQRVQPLIQLAAAFPANLFYPLFVIAISHYKLNVEIWVTPLMILGTQWYILFNVIAGAASIPRELALAMSNFNVSGWQWWKKFAIPGIFPFFITGAITAAGGAWNASIVAEWVSWGSTTLKATGLGAYIQESTLAGDFPKIALGTAMMCAYVLAFNHILWRPLYRLAEKRFNIS
jgi:NitT/TauT family transport system permease protein